MIALETLCVHCINMWTQTDDASFSLKRQPYQKQLANEQRIWELLSLQTELKQHPEKLRVYLEEDEIWNLSNLPKQHQEQFCEITRQFINDAKVFDEKLQPDDIFQALRNVWIILMLEMMLKGVLTYHSAIFSYSMLYPYTDNYLDDPSITKEEKYNFNKRLRNRLLGIAYEKPNPCENKIDQLISNIEHVFHRNRYPEVYESLLCIQKGQEDSLMQQEDQDNMLHISVEKGGSSVLADGFLIDGTLCDEEQRFCMEYGFFLQLADDLQDMVEDRQSGHYTLFHENVDEALPKKLLNYLQSILERQTLCKEPFFCNILEKGCQLLVLGAIIMHHDQFSKDFMKQVFDCFPITKKGLKKMVSSNQMTPSKLLNLFYEEASA